MLVRDIWIPDNSAIMRNHPELLLVAAGLLALAAEAWAGGKEEAEIRTITATTATSDCIGDPRTPVCAVETVLACFARLDRALCEKATRQKVELTGERGAYRYRIVSVRTITGKDIAPEFRDINWWKPGDVNVTIRDLDFVQSWCPNGCEVSFTLRSTLTGWEVLGWAGEGVE